MAAKNCKNCDSCMTILPRPAGDGRALLDYPLFTNLSVRAVYCKKGQWKDESGGDRRFTSMPAFEASKVGAKYAPECPYYETEDRVEEVTGYVP